MTALRFSFESAFKYGLRFCLLARESNVHSARFLIKTKVLLVFSVTGEVYTRRLSFPLISKSF